jgi:5-methylcytosine-specific restriction endonuclease McrA
MVIHTEEFNIKKAEREKIRREELAKIFERTLPNFKDNKLYCIECGEVIVGKHNYNKKYCSYRCRYEYNRDRLLKKAREKNIPKPKIERLPINCKWCNNSFIPRYKQQVYCSKNCNNLFYKNEYKEICNGKEPNNKSKSNSYLKLRFLVFQRDNFTCQYCGRNVKEDKIKLNTDHIIPKSKGGEDTFENITTSCQECNLGKYDILLEKSKDLKGK